VLQTKGGRRGFSPPARFIPYSAPNASRPRHAGEQPVDLVDKSLKGK